MVAMAPTWALVLFRLLIDHFNQTNRRQVRTVGEIWPNLQLFIAGGVALSSYRSVLEDLIGLPTVDYLEVYGASEGFFTFQSDLSDPAMLLHLNNGVFYEFVRMEALDTDCPKRYTIGEVECGVRYAPILTTCSGLYAYTLGDVVRFTSTSPHKIVVAGRTTEMIDKYGEAVFGEDARSAIEAACQSTGSHAGEFHVSAFPPASSQVPYHEWLIEFNEPPAEPTAFIRALDEHLCAINRHYQIRREARAFAAPQVVRLPPGTFVSWFKNSRNIVGGQTKVPRLSEERTVADAVLGMIGDAAVRYRVSGR